MLHFGVNVNRRTILVDRTILSFWIIRLDLEMPFQQWDVVPITKLIYSGSCILMSRQHCMKFMNKAFGQNTILCHGVYNKLNSCFLVSENVDQSRGFNVGARTRNEIFGKAIEN